MPAIPPSRRQTVEIRAGVRFKAKKSGDGTLRSLFPAIILAFQERVAVVRARGKLAGEGGIIPPPVGWVWKSPGASGHRVAAGKSRGLRNAKLSTRDLEIPEREWSPNRGRQISRENRPCTLGECGAVDSGLEISGREWSPNRGPASLARARLHCAPTRTPVSAPSALRASVRPGGQREPGANPWVGCQELARLRRG